MKIVAFLIVSILGIAGLEYLVNLHPIFFLVFFQCIFIVSSEGTKRYAKKPWIGYRSDIAFSSDEAWAYAQKRWVELTRKAIAIDLVFEIIMGILWFTKIIDDLQLLITCLLFGLILMTTNRIKTELELKRLFKK